MKPINTIPLFVRLKYSLRLLFGIDKHWILITYNKKALENITLDNGADICVTTHRTHPYIAKKIIHEISALTDDVDMIVEKANFQVQALEHYKNKK